jgi:hypothetical protein
MSKEPHINSFITERLTASHVTEKDALDCYRRMEKPALDAVGEHFTELGRNLSCAKLRNWAAKGHWGARLDPELGDLGCRSRHSGGRTREART